MPLTKCSNQNHVTFEQFYQDSVDNDHVLPDKGKSMLSMLAWINHTFEKTHLYGFTSLGTLQIKNIDDIITDWFVSIVSLGFNDYYIEYKIPAGKSELNGAVVRSHATSEEQAKRFLLIAMRESNGWVDNLELKEALKRTG